jgi:mono/diheme cytochrome c family protein
MKKWNKPLTTFLGILLATFSSSCVQKMGKDGHLRTYEAARTPPADTIARGQSPGTSLNTGKMPMPITQALLARGRERYNIYCSPCHDFTGRGNGMIVQRGFLPPPSYHTDRLRDAPDSHFFDVISKGYGAMYSYGDRISASDRWAIVAYIRALQLSQNLPLQTATQLLRPEELKKLQESQK